LRRPDERALHWPRQDQLQHHIVGQQDVRRVLEDSPTFFFTFLTGVSGESDRPPAIRVAVAEELAQLVELAVRQRVHRVDYEGTNPLPRALPQDVIDGGNDVREALARAGARGEGVIVAAAGSADGLLLVAVEAQRTPPVPAAAFLLVAPEDASAFR